MLNVLNLGAGRQSSYLYHASGRGLLPKIDIAIFSDTGDERQVTYDHLRWLQTHQERYQIPIVVVGTKSIADDALNSRMMSAGYDKAKGERWAAMPWYVKSPEGKQGMIRRQCTKEYKIEVIEQYIKTELLGLAVDARWPKDQVVRQWFGISYDEYHRMRKPAVTRNVKVQIGVNLMGEPEYRKERKERPIRWKSHVYPLCDSEWIWSGDKCQRTSLGLDTMTVEAVLQWHRENGLAEPPGSACKKCPYRSNKMWREMRDEAPDEFAESCDFDDAIRIAGGMKGETYTHRDLVPLRLVNLDEPDDDDYGLFPCDGGVCAT